MRPLRTMRALRTTARCSCECECARACPRTRPRPLPSSDKEHHDQNSASWSPQGVRVYTFFMYLNDVEEGGETAFSRLDLKVRPRKGSAILWPSVLDSDPNATEPGTYHAALPVGKGLKYGANLWLHMHDFRTPSYHHCLFTMKNTVE